MTASTSAASPGRAAAVKTKRPRYSKLQRREHRAAYLFITPWIIGFSVLTLGAMIYTLILSFSHYDLASGALTFAGAENFQQLLADPKVLAALRNTLFFAVMAVPGQMIVAMVLALLLNSVKRFAGIFRVIYYLPTMTPTVATAAIFLILLNGNQGAINLALKWLGITGPQWLISPGWVIVSIVLMVLWGVGGTMVIMLAALKSVPVDLYEASALDGAGRIRQFFRITVPMISGALFFNVIVLSISALQVFDQAYLLYFQSQGGSAAAPGSSLFIAIYLFQEAFQQFNFGFAAAIAWLVFVLVTIVTIIQTRFGNRFVYYEGA